MLTAEQPHLLMDEEGRPPHRRPPLDAQFEGKPWLRYIFDRGFAYQIGQRFQSAGELIEFMEKAKDDIQDTLDDPVTEYKALLNSPEYKTKDEILDLICRSHKEFQKSVTQEIGGASMPGSGPNVDETGHAVVSHFMVLPPKRTSPKVWWKLTTSLSEDLQTISDFCDFKDSLMRSRTYMVAEQDRLFGDYEKLGRMRGKEALRDLVILMKGDAKGAD